MRAVRPAPPEASRRFFGGGSSSQRHEGGGRVLRRLPSTGTELIA